MVLIYTTCKNEEEGKKLAKLIIEHHMASCVNVWPIQSVYRWEGEIKEDQEAGVLVKTLESKLQPIEDLIMQNHAYVTPFIGAVDVRRINHAYKEWMSEVVR